MIVRLMCRDTILRRWRLLGLLANYINNNISFAMIVLLRSQVIIWAVSLLTQDLIAQGLIANNCIPIFVVSPWVALPPIRLLTLYFNRFRKKPAISKFDWIITPIYNSSQNFATVMSSVSYLIIDRSLSFGYNLYDFLV